jgi:uncharacterized membrane protein YfcA
MEHWEILIFFFSIAILYSSVGFGGGSSYLAILALYGFEYHMLRSTALLCNITVVTFGCYIFFKNGHFNWKKLLPLVIISTPMAYLGGSVRITETTFFILLGIVLLTAAILMWFQPVKSIVPETKIAEKPNMLINGSLGGGIGFLSGMVGIGGGIFLAPFLHLLRWDRPKTIAATASFFILVNSISGLIGQMSQPNFNIDWKLAILLMISVFAGGQIGSRLGAVRFKPSLVKAITAVLVAFVGIRILIKYL